MPKITQMCRNEHVSGSVEDEVFECGVKIFGCPEALVLVDGIWPLPRDGGAEEFRGVIEAN